MKTVNRRQFIASTVAGSAGLCLLETGCGGLQGHSADRNRIAFNTANLVARYTNYRYQLSHWGEQHQKTVAETDATAWRAICREIAATGFRAVEVWEAHAAPESLNRDKAALWKRILDDNGLKPAAYAGGLRHETLQICQWLGIPHVNGGLRGQSLDEATALCREMGVGFNIENHPEKSAAEVAAKVGGGNDWLGVCVDTGWFGTQGANVPETIRTLGQLVRHTHIKDVKASGAHETCLLGDGIVNVEGCLAALKGIGYAGWYSWEDEPEDRNPFDSAVPNRKWLEARL